MSFKGLEKRTLQNSQRTESDWLHQPHTTINFMEHNEQPVRVRWTTYIHIIHTHPQAATEYTVITNITEKIGNGQILHGGKEGWKQMSTFWIVYKRIWDSLFHYLDDVLVLEYVVFANFLWLMFDWWSPHHSTAYSQNYLRKAKDTFNIPSVLFLLYIHTQ